MHMIRGGHFWSDMSTYRTRGLIRETNTTLRTWLIIEVDSTAIARNLYSLLIFA
jgi:hypothetical protein